MDNVKIGQLILKLRKENNMTQLQLADLVLHTPRLVLSEPIKTALSITRVLFFFCNITLPFSLGLLQEFSFHAC